MTETVETCVAQWTCPHCGGTGVTGSRWPQALRTLEEKGRFVVPFPVNAKTYRAELRGAVAWFIPDPQGMCSLVDPGAGVGRLTIPAEFRPELGLKPGDTVALAREGGAILCWAHAP